jgi:hypothetical protein
MGIVMDKRTEARFRSRGKFGIMTDRGQMIDAKLIDTSPSGLGLEVETALESGMPIRLVCNGLEIGEGTVQHCRVSCARFFLGVALSDTRNS